MIACILIRSFNGEGPSPNKDVKFSHSTKQRNEAQLWLPIRYWNQDKYKGVWTKMTDWSLRGLFRNSRNFTAAAHLATNLSWETLLFLAVVVTLLKSVKRFGKIIIYFSDQSELVSQQQCSRKFCTWCESLLCQLPYTSVREGRYKYRPFELSTKMISDTLLLPWVLALCSMIRHNLL